MKVKSLDTLMIYDILNKNKKDIFQTKNVFLWLRGVCKKIGILPISAHSGGNHGKIRKNNQKYFKIIYIKQMDFI